MTQPKDNLHRSTRALSERRSRSVLEDARAGGDVANAFDAVHPRPDPVGDGIAELHEWKARPMLGFKSFGSAKSIVAGTETMHMIKKGQQRCPGGLAISAADDLYSFATKQASFRQAWFGQSTETRSSRQSFLSGLSNVAVSG
jgi:hypothetical protein